MGVLLTAANIHITLKSNHSKNTRNHSNASNNRLLILNDGLFLLVFE